MKPRRGGYRYPDRARYEAVGALHMHTTYSDGTGSPKQLAEHARRRGLDWIIITDHSILTARERGEEGFYGPVCVLVGSELGDEDLPNHYLAYDIDELPDQSDPAHYVREVQRQGGFGAIAHPHERRTAFTDLPPYPWTAWEAPIDGIEIWNQLSQWTEGLTPSNRLHRFIHPLSSLTWPDPETLSTWDSLNRERPVVGYVGVDAHSLRYPILRGLFHVTVFHYRVQFRSLLTHLLLEQPLPRGDFELAQKQIHSALRQGRHYGANHRVGDPGGFRFFAQGPSGISLPISSLPEGEEIEFVAELPLDAEIVLLRNGRPVVKVRGRELRYRSAEKGVWRIEAHRKGRGWIYSNPIRIVGPDNKA